MHRRRKIVLVGGAELRAPKARETSRGVRGHPPRKILKSRVPEMAFPAFLGKSLQNPKRYKTFTVTYTTFTSPSAPKAGGAQPPFFPLLQSWGGLRPPHPPPFATALGMMCAKRSHSRKEELVCCGKQ